MSSIDELQASRLPPKRRRRITTAGIPWYRDLKVLQIISQIVFVIFFVGGLALAFISLATNLANSDLSIDFNVYKTRFGAEVSEGIRFDEEWAWVENFDLTESIAFPIIIGIWVTLTLSYFLRTRERNERLAIAVGAISIALLAASPQIVEWLLDTLAPYLAASTMTRAIITGVYNTLKVVIAAVIASTVLGIFLGVGLLSKNFLVRNFSKIFVEIFRNTPLLVQLIFIHRGMQLILPEVAASWTSPDKILFFDFHEDWYVLNVRGFSTPGLNPTDTAIWFYLFTLAGLICAFFIRRWRINLQEETGIPAFSWRFVIPTVLVFMGIGWLLSGGFPLSSGPFTVEYPQAGRFNIQGGWYMSLAYFALFTGLTLYTGAFIADIVRAGIQSVPFGQIEAARSQGLGGSQVLSLVVLPQALRLIIPPLGNQYVNLGKNSSLGIAVLYFDAYFVVQLANNESGQAVVFFVALMVIYLTISLTLSALTNMVNSFTTIQQR